MNFHDLFCFIRVKEETFLISSEFRGYVLLRGKASEAVGQAGVLSRAEGRARAVSMRIANDIL